MLARDPAEDARAAAALAIGRRVGHAGVGDADDTGALDRCARTDPSSAVAVRCRAGAASTPAPGRTHAVLVFVVPDGLEAPRPNAGYAMLFADGTIRSGTTDRRGAVFEPLAPEGEVLLKRPAP